MGAFHHARPTVQRPEGLTEEEWNDIFRLNQANRKEWLPNPLLKWNQLKKTRNWTGLSISNSKFRSRGSDQSKWTTSRGGPRSEETETDLSIWLPTLISGIFGIMENTVSFAKSKGRGRGKIYAPSVSFNSNKNTKLHSKLIICLPFPPSFSAVE